MVLEVNPSVFVVGGGAHHLIQTDDFVVTWTIRAGVSCGLESLTGFPKWILRKDEALTPI